MGFIFMSQQSYSLTKIAELLNAKVHGDAGCVITGISTLDNAKAGEITFLDNTRYQKYLNQTKASAVILKSNYLEECPTNAVIMDNPYLGFAKVAELFDSRPKPTGIHPTAIIAANCEIHPTANIGPYCVIEENVKIGAHCVLHPHVTIYTDTQIGHRTIIHSGVVIGSDGFGFANDKGVWHKVPQLGGVTIGDDVEIGANTTIDRGALSNTIIENGVKLDNHIQIGHNVHVGAHTAIAACTAIAGSVRIGKNCMIGGNTGIAGHLELADRVIITGMSRVTGSIHQAGVYSSGSPIQPNNEWRKNSVRMRQLDDLARKVKSMEKVLSNISARE